MKSLRRGVAVFLFVSCLTMVLVSNLVGLFPPTLSPLANQVVAVANFFGLTQSYMMFAVVGREGTDLEISATTQKGEKRNLTDEVFFRPGFLNQNFFDHKSGKMIHVLIASPASRETFLDYLCRTSKDQDGQSYQEIILIGSGREFLKSGSPKAAQSLYGDRKISLYLARRCAGAP
ncbi:MAG: hypothetical protein ACK5P7_11840 [Bdellovibrio sp.]